MRYAKPCAKCTLAYAESINPDITPHVAQKVKILLIYHDFGLHGVCKTMPSMPKPRKVYKTLTWSPAHYLPLMAFGASKSEIFRPFETITAQEYEYLLAVVDCFPKWAEAIPIHDFIIMAVSDFIRTLIIIRFGILETITIMIINSRVQCCTNYIPSNTKREIIHDDTTHRS